MPLSAEVPATYRLNLEVAPPLFPDWISIEALRHDRVLRDHEMASLSDDVSYARAKLEPDEGGCYVGAAHACGSSKRWAEAADAFRESPKLARDHANLIVRGVVTDLAPGRVGLSTLGTLLEIQVTAEHKRGPGFDDWLLEHQRSGPLEVIYVFVPMARFEWDGHEICFKDPRFSFLPSIGEEVAVMLFILIPTAAEKEEWDRLLEQERREYPELVDPPGAVNAEKVVFLQPHTTAVFRVEGSGESFPWQ